jgi:hypothetical protein
MEATNQCGGDSQFPRTSRLLPKIYVRIFEYCKTLDSPDIKGKEYKWTKACEDSFQELKTRLTTAPILMLLDIHQSFIVYCDSSRQGLGCVLTQDDKVVAYAP